MNIYAPNTRTPTFVKQTLLKLRAHKSPINGAKNAAILAVQMMGTNDPAMLQKVADLKAAMAEA